MPVPDLIFLGICGAVTMVSVGTAIGCAIGIGNVRRHRDEARAEAVRWKARWRGAENELMLHRAGEPARIAAAIKQYMSTNGRKGAPLGNTSPVRAEKRAAKRLQKAA